MTHTGTLPLPEKPDERTRPAERGAIEAIYRLSPMQRGLLFHSLLDPESAVYVEQIACNLQGSLDIEAFEKAWQQVLDRHGALRTSFVWKGVEEPVQVVQKALPLPLEVLDWRNLDYTECATRLAAFEVAERSRGFDLSRGPLLRLALVLLRSEVAGESDYRFILTHHHLILDGWSQAVVLREVFRLYRAVRQGDEVTLPAPPSFRSYVNWLERQDRQASEAFWRHELAGFGRPTDFGGHRHGRVRAASGEERTSERTQLPVAATTALKALAREQGLTLGVMVQAAWALLASRYSGEAEVLFGVTVAGRPPELEDAESMVGLFINTLPLRIRVPERESVGGWLKALHARQGSLLEHQHTPLHEIQRWSELEVGRPLFESLCVVENHPPIGEASGRDLGLRILDLDIYATANYPLALVATPGDQLLLRLVFDPQRFERQRIRSMLEQLNRLLETLALSLDAPLAGIALMTAEERRQVLEEWSHRPGIVPSTTIPQLFEEQAARFPEQRAVVFGKQELSYGELDEQANRLAALLRRHGVTSGRVVGLYLERSLEMVISLLAILKAGGAYLHLDPSYPPARLELMIRDGVTSERILWRRAAGTMEPAAQLVALETVRWIDVDADETVGERLPLDLGYDPEALAYVSYTSGSTGVPKGVEVVHRAVVRLVCTADYVNLERCTFLQVSPLAFDASTLEIWGPLLNGGCCVLLPPGAPTAAQMGRVIAEQGVDSLWLTASLYNAVIDEAPQALRGIRQLLIGGEALSIPHVRKGLECLPEVRLINGYGPTENTTFTCCYEVATAKIDCLESIPIGRPVVGTQVYVLERRLEPVPPGVAGELFTGGDGLARGYHQRPALTAERFVPDLFSGIPGQRLYRTGDLVRFCEDGLIEFLGRVDEQVKLRGFRIEPGEVEAILRQQSGVQDAAVVLDGSAENRRLIAYVATAGREVDVARLRSELSTRMPEYMLPAVFVALDSLPLTVSGKLDRHRLPRPEPEAVEVARTVQPLRSPQEELLAEIWAHVLGVETMGRDMDFFELGGDSLLATRLMARVHDAFGVELPLRRLFEGPTVGQLAAQVISLTEKGQASLPHLVPLPRSQEPIRLAVSFAQQRLWFLDQLTGPGPSYNVNAALELEGPLDLALLVRSLNEVVRRHEVLRTTFHDGDAGEAEVVQQVSSRLRLKVPMVDLSGVPAQRRAGHTAALVSWLAHRPFNLGRGPLLRLHALRLGQGRHILHLSLHHIVSDGWSLGILVHELNVLYQAFSEGRPSPLPELALQYADFAAWQRGWLRGEVLEQQIAFWRQQLGEETPVLRLVADHPRPVAPSLRGAHQPLRVDDKSGRALRELARRTASTPFMVLATAYQALLGRLTGQRDLVIGTPIAGRSRSRLDELIGCFVNTLVLRADLGGGIGFRQAVRRFRDRSLAAFAHQDLPFERLVDEFQGDRDLGMTPLFQAMFVLQDRAIPKLTLPQVEARPLAVDIATAKFDLTLTLAPAGFGFTGSLEYSTDLYEAVTAGRMVGWYQRLLEAAVEEPEVPIFELSLLSQSERQQLVEEWNDSTVRFLAAEPLHRLFEVQAASRPEAIALTYSDGDTREVFTYGELNRRANRLANYLRALGVEPGEFVGLSQERTPELVLSLLAVLKAGAAYVPLDPDLPTQRLQFLVEDSGIRLVIVADSVLAKLPEFQNWSTDQGVLLVRPDADAPDFSKCRDENLKYTVDPASAAYVIYTSGSTGRPKGVLISHANVLRLFHASESFFDFTDEDVWLLFHSFAFDFSVWEIWGALLHGGRLVVVPYWVSRAPEEFYELLFRERVTVLNQTPSAFRQLVHVEEARADALPLSLRWVIFGGEAVDLPSLGPWFERHGDRYPRLVNMYGITETTVHVTFHSLGQVSLRGRIGTPIGRPLSDLQVYVLDARLALQPIGIPGELCVAGAGLACGYKGRPGLTAQRFIPDPFSSLPGQRLYRSGDLGRYRIADTAAEEKMGELEYLGRIDQQVKVRGFRIELGEIETTLLSHPLVRDAVVIVEANQEPRLLAYYVPRAADLVVSETLRTFLTDRLPAYMVPAVFISLAAIPLTSNGKIDRRALPMPPTDRPDLATDFTEPTNAGEVALAGVWAAVLGLEKVGLHDNFFSLGGDSIVSLRLRSAAARQGIEFSLQDLFLHPTVGSLAAVLQLSANLPEESFSKVQSETDAGPFSLISTEERERLPAELEDAYPATRLQAGMLFHGAYSPQATTYHDLLSFELTASFDGPSLRRAVADLMAGHEVLRTSFEVGQFRRPMQLVWRQAPDPMVVIDLTRLKEEPQEQRRIASEQVEKERRRSISWEEAPLVRILVHQFDSVEFQLTLSFHHAILDGWSVALALTELFQRYMALLGKDVPLHQGQPPPFRQFVALELAAVRSEASREFWRQELWDLPPATIPQRERVEGEVQVDGPKVQSVFLEPALSARLFILQRSLGVPLKSLLLAAHLRVLQVVSGQREVVTGWVSNGRLEQSAGDQALGLFLNTLPLRLCLSGGSWRELIQQVFRREEKLLRHRRFPIEELHSGGQWALFETVFNFNHFHVYRALEAFPDVGIRNILAVEETEFPFGPTFSLDVAAQHVQLRLDYDGGRYGTAHVASIGGLYQRALEALARDLDARYENDPLLSAAERQQLLAWAGAAAPMSPAENLIVAQFKRRAQLNAESPAIQAGDLIWSYGRLDRAASRLASHLRSLGLGAESRIGLSLERAPRLLVGILGILKSGAAYVPLDPAYPQERLAAMIADAEVDFIVTETDLAETFEVAPSRLVLIDAEGVVADNRRADGSTPLWSPGQPQISAEQLAYVFFTSGSSGRPKGVGISHGNLSWFAAAASRFYGLEPRDRVLQFASISFDISIDEIFPALAAGACLVLRNSRMGDSMTTLLKECERHAVTVLIFATAYWHELANVLKDQSLQLPAAVKMVGFGGERVSPVQIVSWQERLGGRVRLVNTYGPTETTVEVLVEEISDDWRPTLEIPEVPLGYPLEGGRAVILDRFLQLVPQGTSGELCLGGGGVGRGYLGRPAATAAVFVPDPFAPQPGQRLYRTGDRARHLANGKVDFLGRLDRQLKLQGFRVEPQEVEAVLERHPAIRESAVVLRHEGEREAGLAAFLVLEGMAAGRAPGDNELRSFLAPFLPPYMVPRAFFTLERLPLTPVGKVDRKALSRAAEPVGGARAVEREFVEARTDRERKLAAIWSSILNVEPLGIHDNFFELGGDSILSLQVVARARSVGLKLTPKLLFEHPTVAELAVVTTVTEGQEELPLVGAVPLTPIQQWFFLQDFPQPHHWNQSLFLEVREPFDPALLSQALEHLVVRHDALRLRFNCDCGTWTQQVVAATEAVHSFVLQHFDLRGQSSERQRGELERVATAVQLQLDLNLGPVLRGVYFDLGSDRPARLLLVAHHLVVDGVSWRILVEELLQVYRQLEAGKGPHLPTSSLPFSRWAERLAKFAKSSEVVSELNFWQGLMTDAGTRLPRDGQGPNRFATVCTQTIALTPGETEDLLRKVPAAYRTRIDEVLLTALAWTLSNWLDDPAVLVELEGHGREELFDGVDLSRTVGWFTTQFPVRLEPGSGPEEPGVALKRIKEGLRKIPHGGVGYGLLTLPQQDEEIRRILSSLPRADVLFNYLGQLDVALPEASPFAPARESTGAPMNSGALRSHALEITARVSDGVMRLAWSYCTDLHDEATVASLCDSYLKGLRGLIYHCLQPGAGGCTPSDFPLAQRLDQASLDALAEADPRNLEDLYPLSPMQEGMLFQAQYSPLSEIDFEQVAVVLEGPLQPQAFKEAWCRLVHRHPILRTSFHWEHLDHPLQAVQRRLTVPWTFDDWQSRSLEEQDQALEELRRNDRRHPFDLQQAPLLRFQLIRLGIERWFFLWSHHHLLLDGWSLPLLLTEFFQLYDFESQGREEDLPIARPYRDYIAWLQRQNRKAAEDFWRESLQGVHGALPLGVEQAIPVAPGPMARCRHRLTAELTERAEAFVRRHGLTLSTLLHGAWGLLLSRYTGEQDVVFGSVAAGRPADLGGAESMIGLFINTLPVRLRVPVHAQSAQWLRKVQETLVQMRQFEYSPLAQVQTWSGLPSSVPLFETLLAFENYPGSVEPVAQPTGLVIRERWLFERPAYPLVLVALPGQALQLEVQYDSDRYEEAVVERLLGHLVMLLDGLIQEKRPLALLPLMQPEEIRQVLVEWNDTLRPYPRQKTLPELFEAQVDRTPEAWAVELEGRPLSYRQLNRLANLTAHELRRQGVRPEAPVGLFVERSIEMVVGLLAILKAGGTYLPLDPTYPDERLGWMLADACREDSPRILTQSKFRGRLKASEIQLPDIDFSELAEAKETVEASNLDPWTVAENLAYVMYTSGSTGQPKGVAVCHRNVVRLVQGNDFTHFGPEETFLQLAPISFDASTLELWAPLLNGGRLVLMPPGRHSLEQLSHVIRQGRVTSLWLTAGLFHQVVDERVEDLEGLRQLLAGGDVLSVPHVRRFLEAQPHCALINGYGPTENTTFSCCFQVREGFSGSVPIGRPIRNSQAYVLDRQLEIVPCGVAGELLVGGDGLARGYLHRPALTAERFIPSPVSSSGGQRLYRTGDRVRWLASGNLQFLGRLDDQVKVRGFRVEPGEIEAALEALDSVEQVVVVVGQNEAVGECRLVACVVPADDSGRDSTALTERLRNRLPEYMIPGEWFFLDQLPLTPNGKVDRWALARLQPAAVTRRSHAAPRTPIEEELVVIWADVLEVDPVGIRDDFFELGGHSLLATRMVSRIRRTFGVEVPLGDVFEATTVEALARRVAAALGIKEAAQAPPLIRVDRAGRLPQSFAQQRLWFLDQLEPARGVYNVPAAVRLDRGVRLWAVEQALSEIVCRHEALRTTFSEEDGNPVQTIQQPVRFSLPVIDLTGLRAADTEARRLAGVEAERAFDLSGGPVFRGCVLDLGAWGKMLLLSVHHIVSDGWSMDILQSELITLYQAALEGFSSPLPELPVQYADFAIWQRQWLSGKVLERQLEYWRQQLGQAAVLDLPTDRPRPAEQTFAGASCSRRLTPELWSALHEQSQKQAATPFMLLLAAFEVLLLRCSGQSDLSVGTPVAGRRQLELEPLIGFFVNTLVLRNQLSYHDSFQEVVTAVRSVTLDAYAHQDMPFEKLVKELDPARSLSRTPLFQVMFLLQDRRRHHESVELLGQPLVPELRTTKFDLTLGVMLQARDLIVSIEYNTDLFEATTAQRWLGNYAVVLEEALRSPDTSVMELPWLTLGERHQVVTEWNGKAAAYGAVDNLAALFEQQVVRTPDAIAIVFDSQSLTYRQLDRRANQLARRLQDLGVGPEIPVGICLERSLDMVVAVLATLKAGGAFLPLDPGLPEQRVAFMLEDAGLPVLVTREGLLPVSTLWGGRILRIDQEERWIAEKVADPLPLSSADTLAYVIYTSGSTGKPKGVMNAHRGICNRILWMCARFPLTEQDAVLQKTPLTFDVAVAELFWPLLSGARLVLARPQGHKDASYLVDVIRSQGVTQVHFVPSMLQAFLEEQGVASCTSLRRVLCSGEALSLAHQQRVLALLPVELHNLYGPTEAAVDVTHHLCLAGRQDAPLGRPISNIEIHLLDLLGQAVPIGVSGEVSIGGLAPARGYLHRPALTAEKFVPDPFASIPGQRLYRTGDLARFNPRGEIEYQGRLDHQVKVRGNRIELGEVETALRRYPGLSDVAVVAREDMPGQRRLVAYVVPLEGRPLSIGDLRHTLQEQLPDYMIPSAFVRLDSLPLLSNGKVDRKSLPQPEIGREETVAPYAAPRSVEEAALSRIWAEVLRVHQVGIHDNFFELGGDSILSIQIVSRARQVGIELVPRMLFQHQTVADLARFVAKAETSATVIAIDEETGGEFFSLAPSQAWFFEQGMVNPDQWNLAVFLEVGRPLAPGGLLRVVRSLMDHHEALRLRFQLTTEGWKQYVAISEGEAPFSCIDLAQVPKAIWQSAVETLAEATQRSLDLQHGPVFRLIHFTRGDLPGRLLLVVHHLAVDAVSFRILLEDLENSYARLEDGKAPDLGRRTSSFRRWVERIGAFAQTAEFLREADFWLSQNRDSAMPLPADHRGGDNTVASMRQVQVTLEAEETRQLLKEVPRAYRTQINDVLLTALGGVLCRWSKGDAVLVDLEGHGREELLEGLDLSRTVGWFTALFPVLLGAVGRDLGQALKATKELLRGIPNKGVGYGLLRYLSSAGEISARIRALPSPQVTFNYVGQVDQVLAEDSAFRMALEDGGSQRSRQAGRHHLLEVAGSVVGGQLRLSWMFSDNVHDHGTIEKLASEYLGLLRQLIRHCTQPDTFGYSPSDFPLAALEQKTLDRVLADLPDAEDLYPLSPMQQGILFETLYSPDSVEYFNQLTYKLHGELDVESFCAAWQACVDRHPIFRTAFLWQDLVEPLQVVVRRARLEWDRRDWTEKTPEQQARDLDAYLEEDHRRGFDLGQAPLMRMALFRLSERTWLFSWSHMHLLVDGWSLPLLFQEVFVSYGRLARGDQVQFDSPRPFRDYVSWLRQQDLTAAEGWWRRYLDGFSRPTVLRQDQGAIVPAASSESRQAPRYEAQELRLSDENTQNLQELARGRQLTLNTLVQGVWGLLLCAYSGKTEVVYGTVVAGRPAELDGIDRMIGPFINALPVRLRLEPHRAFGAWLESVQQQLLDLRQYEFSSLVQVQGWSDVPRGTPLFESSVAFDNYPDETSGEERQAGIVVDEGRYMDWNSYPISLDVAPGRRLSIRIKYNQDRFEVTAVEGIIQDLAFLLGQLTESMDLPLGDLLAQLEEDQKRRRSSREEQFQASLQNKLSKLRRRSVARES